jgi:hypothetical protein
MADMLRISSCEVETKIVTDEIPFTSGASTLTLPKA